MSEINLTNDLMTINDALDAIEQGAKPNLFKAREALRQTQNALQMAWAKGDDIARSSDKAWTVLVLMRGKCLEIGEVAEPIRQIFEGAYPGQAPS